MARPKKNDLEYFSHDKDLRNDVKIKALRRKFKLDGYAVYVMMLEHLANCDYLQYEWNDLNIELLTPDFDIDVDYLKEIIEYSIRLKLFEKEHGWIWCPQMLIRNQHILGKRDGFNLNNSPIVKLRDSLRNNNHTETSDNYVKHEFNKNKPDDNVHSIVKDRIEQDSTEHNSTEQDSTEYNSTEQDSTEYNSTEQDSTEYNSTEQDSTEYKTNPVNEEFDNEFTFGNKPNKIELNDFDKQMLIQAISNKIPHPLCNIALRLIEGDRLTKDEKITLTNAKSKFDKIGAMKPYLENLV